MPKYLALAESVLENIKVIDDDIKERAHFWISSLKKLKYKLNLLILKSIRRFSQQFLMRKKTFLEGRVLI